MARTTIRVLMSGVLTVASAAALSGQEQTVTVIVEHVAGANLYLDEGAEQGIQQGDTLTVFHGNPEQHIGYFLVVTASATRSVVTFLAEPFAITRGQTLQLRLAREVFPARREAIPMRQVTRGSRYRQSRPAVRGRISVALDGIQSSTTPLGADGQAIQRTFLTPSVRLRTSVGQLPGGMRFRTNMRLAARYASENTFDATRSARIYQASVARTAGNVRFEAGRFYNPYENYSGYWDGAMLRLGNQRAGIGAVVGFEPDRGNELFNSEIAKYSVFADFEYASGPVRYRTDISFHRVDPQPGLNAHTFLGWSQTVGIGRFRLTQRSQLDRDPQSNKLVFTNIQARIATPLTRTMSLRARYVYRRPYFIFRPNDEISYRREEANLGVSFSGPEGSMNFDVGADRIETGPLGWSYSSSFNLGQTVIRGLSLSGAARYWTRQGLTGFYASPGIGFTSSVVRLIADYRVYITDIVNGKLTTHGTTLGITVPIGRSSYMNARVGTQRGDRIKNISVSGGLSVSF